MRLEQLLESSARASPESVALTDSAGCCTYQALDSFAQTIAEELAAIGVVAGDRVGLCASKRVATVAALFGILKAGAAYVPVDLDAPMLRSATILCDCAVRAILVDPASQESLALALERSGYMVHRGPAVGEFESLIADVRKPKSDASLAYVLYTSGSTGKPKGVAHTHASALAFIDWCSAEFRPSPQDRFISLAPFHFDLSTLDLYVSLKHGSSLRLVETLEGRSPAYLATLVASERVSFWYSTPTILRAMTELVDLGRLDHSSLRIVCFAGEVFPVKHLQAIMKAWPRPAYYNLYGPTETNVCTFYRVPPSCEGEPDSSLPIGLPCSGDRVKLVDENGQAVDDGQEGELLVSGPSVMQGYWACADANARAFVCAEGVRWYRTGDRVQQREDGKLIFRGRLDRMVKRRGFRIELGEIEAAIALYDVVSEVAAIAVDGIGGDTRIAVFITTVGRAVPSYATLKLHCSRHLPLYMSPDLFHALDALPMTSTGKTDHTRLKEIARVFFD